jgi:hypothetical protein
VATTNAKEYIKCMDEIKTLYKRRGFNIVEINCNYEFHKAMDDYLSKQDPPIKMNYAAAQHVLKPK